MSEPPYEISNKDYKEYLKRERIGIVISILIAIILFLIGYEVIQ